MPRDEIPDEQPERFHRDAAAALLDPANDPGGFEFGVQGSEAGSDLNWFAMLRTRVQSRAATSGNHQWLVLGALLAGVLALNFTFTVFIVSLPKVAGEFNTSITTLTWTMTGPLLAYGLAAPLLGKAGDIFGHRRLYLFGLFGAMISAVLTAIAPNVLLLLEARTLDGIQGAATGTASMALIMLTFRPEERVKAMGWWTLAGAGGPVIGVSVGAPVIQYFGWRALFWIQLVVLLIAFVVVALVLPAPKGSPAELAARKREARASFKTMDWVGSTSLSVGVTAIMLGLSLAPSKGWSSVWVLGSWLAAIVGIGTFAVRVRTAENPLIPARYFTKRNFVLPMVIRATSNFAYFGAFYLFPLLMEEGYGFSIGRVGAFAIARPLTFALCSPAAGYVAVKIGERTSVLVGTFVLTLSLVLFALMAPSTPYLVVIFALVFSGLGMGVAMPSTSSIMANEVDLKEMGVMSAAQMLAMQVGEVAGIQVLVMIQQGQASHRHLLGSSDAAALLSTFHTPFVIGAVVALGGVVCSFFLRSVPRGAGSELVVADHGI